MTQQNPIIPLLMKKTHNNQNSSKTRSLIGLKSMKITSLITAGILGTSIASQAAVIAWGDSTSVSTASDISTAGTLVEAINLTADNISGTTVVANGVIFTNDGSLLSKTNGGDNFSGDTGDAGYNEILSTFDFGNGSGVTTLNLGGGNLELDKDYEIQVFWAYDNWDHGYGDGNGNNVILTEPAYVIGTFTADGTTQTFDLRPVDGSWTEAHLNAYQIRAVPEPSSAALFGLGGLALILRRRK